MDDESVPGAAGCDPDASSEPVAATTVVIPAHTEDRWTALVETVASARRQRPEPASIVVAVDHNPGLLERVGAEIPGVHAVENTFARGASGARNSGALHADTPLIAFLDSDVRARSGWLHGLLAAFREPMAVGAGGFVAPVWRAGRPAWFPDEFAWVVSASYRGLPTSIAAVRNGWGENMAVRRDIFHRVGGFRVDFGKVGNVSRPEDTDLCVRMTRAAPGAIWMFVPDAIVDHEVGPERSRFGFFVRRCYNEGQGKVEFARLNQGRHDLRDEFRYFGRTLPSGIRRYLGTALRSRDWDAVRCAGVIVVGMAAAGTGVTASLATGAPIGRRRQRRPIRPRRS